MALGALIMIGWLASLIVLVYGLVLRFDPGARRSDDPKPDDR
jgi:hypothetical protein